MAAAEDAEKIRSKFYGTLGFRSIVDEKRALEVMLSQNEINLSNLKDHCSKYSLPAEYRNFVWKLLLGIITPIRVNHEFTDKINKDLNNSMTRWTKAVSLFRGREHEETVANVNFAKWLTLKRKLHFHTPVKFDPEGPWTAISNNMCFYFTSDEDKFYATMKFYEKVLPIQDQIAQLTETTHSILSKHRPGLYKRLENIKLLEHIPFQKWFERCFAGILHERALVKLWDRIIAGVNFKILSYTAASIIICFNRTEIDDVSEILKLMEKISEEDSESILRDVFKTL